MGASAIVAATSPAFADDWEPNGPLTIQIGFGAGGYYDTMGRVLGKVIKDNTGWNVVVENKPGGVAKLPHQKTNIHGIPSVKRLPATCQHIREHVPDTSGKPISSFHHTSGT